MIAGIPELDCQIVIGLDLFGELSQLGVTHAVLISQDAVPAVHFSVLCGARRLESCNNLVFRHCDRGLLSGVCHRLIDRHVGLP